MNRKDIDRLKTAKRARAITRPELRESPYYIDVNTSMPDVDRPCTAWATDALEPNRPYRLTFPVVWDGKIWRNANKENPLAVKVIGWHYRSMTDSIA